MLLIQVDNDQQLFIRWQMVAQQADMIAAPSLDQLQFGITVKRRVGFQQIIQTPDVIDLIGLRHPSSVKAES